MSWLKGEIYNEGSEDKYFDQDSAPLFLGGKSDLDKQLSQNYTCPNCGRIGMISIPNEFKFLSMFRNSNYKVRCNNCSKEVEINIGSIGNNRVLFPQNLVALNPEKYNIPSLSLNNTDKKEVQTMETKSRYEVIGELEQKKRELIKEKNSLGDTLLAKEKNLKLMKRQKEDNIMILDRQIADSEDDLDNFKKTMEEKKETITELIKSVDESLERFNKINQTQSK